MTRDSGFSLRPATAEDVRKLYADAPPVSIKAWTCERNGEVCGIGGVLLFPKKPTVFLRVSENCGMPKRQILLAIRQGMGHVAAFPGVLLAIRDAAQPNSAALLKRAGFAFYATDNDNNEVYVR